MSLGTGKHVSIRGIEYRLAEDAEGEHYVRERGPLRAPNTQVVQGDPGQFNIRTDLLLWSMIDWSGGDMQFKFDSRVPNRFRESLGMDSLSVPGTLRMGYPMGHMDDSGAATFTENVYFAIAHNVLYAVEQGTGSNNNYYKLGSKTAFTAASTITGATDGLYSPHALIGDDKYLYLVERQTDKVWRFDGTTWLLLNDQTGGGTLTQLAEMGPNIYKYDHFTGDLYELSKTTANTATPEVPLYSILGTANVGPNFVKWDGKVITTGGGRIYILQQQYNKAIVHEIIPTTAAGTGYGRILAEMEGAVADSIWYHDGFIYLSVTDAPMTVSILNADKNINVNREIKYIQVGGAMGSLGYLGDKPATTSDNTRGPRGRVIPGANHLTTFAVATTPSHINNSSNSPEIALVDSVTGGIHWVTNNTAADVSLGGQNKAVSDLVYFDGVYYVAMNDAVSDGGNYVAHFNTRLFDDGTADDSSLIFASNDFGISEEKVLHSFEVITEPLPANTVVLVQYMLDDGNPTSLVQHSTTGATSKRVVVSTSTATKKFNSLQMKLTLRSSDGADTPVVKALNVYATVAKRVRTWTLLLDISDSQAVSGYGGAELLQNLELAVDDEVVAFIDGYRDRGPASAITYDVIFDRELTNLSYAQEGVVMVVLREVI